MRNTLAVAAVAAALAASPAVAAAQSLDMGSLGSSMPGSSAACAETSTQFNRNGWAPRAGDAAGRYTEQNVDDTDGSLDLSKTEQEDGVSMFHSAGGVRLDDVTEMGYAIRTATAHETGDTGLNPNYQLIVDLGDGKTATLSYEPLYQGPERPGINPGEWAYPTETSFSPSDEDTNWITIGDITDAEGNVVFEDQWPTFSMQEFLAEYPDATVTSYGVSYGKGSTPAETYADNVSFNGCSTNFMATPGLFGSLGS